MHHDPKPELSIIVPVLNEAAELPALFETLAAQQGIRFELILCDGGSSDGTLLAAAKLAASRAFTLHSTVSPPGRGCQMNVGAARATSALLLFLHADSRFTVCTALQSACSAYETWVREAASPTIAARFALHFRRSNASPSLAYFFYEAKSRLNRTECIRGDQGFMLSRAFFHQLGGFAAALPFYEDVMMAAQVARHGSWRLLPVQISTSARRFEAEGLAPRQVVNAIIVNAAVVGWAEFFTALSGLYRCHAETGRLLLFPLLEGIRTLIAGHDHTWRRTFWRATGGHVAANAWQLFFWLDVRRAYRAGREPGEATHQCLGFFERRLARLFHGTSAAFAAAALVWLWFRLLHLRCGRSEP